MAIGEKKRKEKEGKIRQGSISCPSKIYEKKRSVLYPGRWQK